LQVLIDTIIRPVEVAQKQWKRLLACAAVAFGDQGALVWIEDQVIRVLATVALARVQVPSEDTWVLSVGTLDLDTSNCWA
jgi:hypothetical protein